MGDMSMTWTGCETIEETHSDFYGTGEGLLLVLSVSDHHHSYNLHLAMSYVTMTGGKELELRMFNPYLGQDFESELMLKSLPSSPARSKCSA